MAELENPIVMTKVITFLSSLVQRVAESNDINCEFQPQKISVFHGQTRPPIAIQGYLERIFKYYNNAYYAKVGGISTIEMNFLEVDFLFGLNFNLNVTPSTFTTYCSYLQREMLLVQPPLDSADSSLSLGKSLKLHLCFDEGETSHQQQQLAV
ncbi:PREDICTED: cyclin-U4-1 [Prunus dulcis]|uniref:PREDICTED: cyclin-U4-1 n=1 Tax=Prunus dulcis TaxID=3755 RepID=A0A5E4GQV8_PRUDU|nr:PREDICTED: cyclin-U4-1 [Prunus dulcis]